MKNLCRIGINTINLSVFAFARIIRTKGENSEGKFAEVYLLSIHFVAGKVLELLFDTQEACEGARDFLEKTAGGASVMPDVIITKGKETTPDAKTVDKPE